LNKHSQNETTGGPVARGLDGGLTLVTVRAIMLRNVRQGGLLLRR